MSRKGLRAGGLAILLVTLVLAPLVVWGATSVSDDDGEELLVRTYGARGPGAELVVSLPDEDLNTLETTGGERSVGLECFDAGGVVRLRVEHLFPFTDTDGGLELPHVHQRGPDRELAMLDRCRLEGTSPPLEGAIESAG